MKITASKSIRLLLTSCAFLASTAGNAAQTWTLNDFDCGAGSSYGNSWSAKSGSGCSGATEVAATAWSNTAAGSTTIATAQLNKYSGGGFGVANQIETTTVTSPNHALDGSGQTDLVLFNFTTSAALDKLRVGYINTDSDLSVLAWTGVNAPPVAGKTLAGLVTSGWTLVGNYANLTLNTDTAINAGNISSSWWLISAYNSAWGAGTGLDSGNDYVKLLTIATKDVSRVAEPGSLALAGIAMFGMLMLRRKERALGKERATG